MDAEFSVADQGLVINNLLLDMEHLDGEAGVLILRELLPMASFGPGDHDEWGSRCGISWNPLCSYNRDGKMGERGPCVRTPLQGEGDEYMLAVSVFGASVFRI